MEGFWSYWVFIRILISDYQCSSINQLLREREPAIYYHTICQKAENIKMTDAVSVGVVSKICTTVTSMVFPYIYDFGETSATLGFS